MILTTDKMVFVTDLENSDEYIENLTMNMALINIA